MTEPAPAGAVRYDVADGVATITLNRPDQLNAMNDEMFRGLLAAFDRSDGDDAVRAVVVTGAGRGFCAGADLSGGAATFDYDQRVSALYEDSPERPLGVEAHRDRGGQVVLRIFRSLKPVIAAINGPAVGVGLTMTLPMDVRIMADTAKAGFVFARRGIVPDGASSWFLPRVVGISQALEWCLTGRVFPASEALAGGLVKATCPAAEVLPAATALAREMAAGAAPVSAVITRHLLWQGLGADHPMASHRIESRAIFDTGRLADSAEGVAAFLEKRDPAWTMAPSRDLPDWFPWRPEPPFAE
jgi:enoyl-CoA hydratase/carnithine racemase